MTTVQSVRNTIRAGRTVTVEELLTLLEITDSDELNRLYWLADELNQEVNGNRVSFILNRNINYTNVCELRCAFCAYYSVDRHTDYLITPAEITAKIAALNISEVTFQGGLNPAVTAAYITTLLRHIKHIRPDIHVHGFSPMEIYYYARKEQCSAEEILRTLQSAGLDSLCGTAAEILDDTLREEICPHKLSTEEWCEIIKTAHRLGIPSTATIMFGHIERPEHIARHFLIIRELAEATGMLTEFIPLPFMPYKTVLGRRHALGFIGVEAVKKVTACARIFFHGSIRNIQTSWVKLGLAGALECLTAGANDVGGTLYEENITRLAGGSHGQYISCETFEEELSSRGKKPVIRDTLYSFQKQDVSV